MHVKPTVKTIIAMCTILLFLLAPFHDGCLGRYLKNNINHNPIVLVILTLVVCVILAPIDLIPISPIAPYFTGVVKNGGGGGKWLDLNYMTQRAENSEIMKTLILVQIGTNSKLSAQQP